MSYKRLIGIFEDHLQVNPTVSSSALYLMGLYIKQSETVFQHFKPLLGSKGLFTKIHTLLTTKEAVLKEQMKKMEGTNYGHPITGYFDHVFSFLNTYLDKISASKEDVNLLFVLLRESGLDQKTLELIDKLDQDLYMSPKGLLSYLMLICDCANMKKQGGAYFSDNILSSSLISRYNQLLSENQCSAIKDWPANLGGGEQGAELLVLQTIRIYHLCFNQNVG